MVMQATKARQIKFVGSAENGRIGTKSQINLHSNGVKIHT